MDRAIVAGLRRPDRMLLTQVIEAAGFDVIAAPTIAQLKVTLESHASSVLFLDVALDDAGGLDLLAMLPLTRQHRVVLVCRDTDDRDSFVAIESDVVSCICLPINERQVASILNGFRRREHRGQDTGTTVFESMLGNCPQMLEVYELIAKVAPTDATVLICGESGTGKELVAQAIHHRSDRSDKRFVAINCGAIAENLIESELFGHTRGSFTGAEKAHPGVFEQADGGTLFLDEVTEMPEQMQVRLLRVLESGKVRRVGAEGETNVDVRVIAATNRDPQVAINEGRFREDVMFRLAVFPITLPPLKARGSDIVLLANHFLSQHNKKSGTDKRFSGQGIQRLLAYEWPGNVRQLRNIVQRAYILEGGLIDVECLEDLIVGASAVSCDQAINADPPASAESQPANGQAAETVQADQGGGHASVSVAVGSSIDDAERALILKTLEEMDGDKPRAAKILGISLKTLYNRLNEYEAEASAG